MKKINRRSMLFGALLPIVAIMFMGAYDVLDRYKMLKAQDIQIVDAPNNPKVGEIVVQIWPHELVFARIRTIRGESFISGTEFTVELKTDQSGKYID